MLYVVSLHTQISVNDFSKDPSVKQYVYLKAQFPNRVLEKVVLASMQPGYILIQTDKPIYTPNSYGEEEKNNVYKKFYYYMQS